jgi:hypothetical protein
MDLIGREELNEKLDRGDDFKLVMVLGEWEYRATATVIAIDLRAIMEA